MPTAVALPVATQVLCQQRVCEVLPEALSQQVTARFVCCPLHTRLWAAPDTAHLKAESKCCGMVCPSSSQAVKCQKRNKKQNFFPAFLLESNVLLLTAQREKKSTATTQTTWDKGTLSSKNTAPLVLPGLRGCDGEDHVIKRCFVFWYQSMLLVINTVRNHCPIFHSTACCSYQSFEENV